MKKHTIIGLLIGAALVMGCAKQKDTSDNADNKAYIEAWLKNNYPGINPTGVGIYILSEQPGTGKTYNGETFIQVRYNVEDMDGNITSTTDIPIAQQLGTYNISSNYYGPVIYYTDEEVLSAGLEEIFSGMRVGGTRKALVPAWLMSSKHYSNPDDYYRKVNGDNFKNTIYTFTLEDFFTDVDAWEKGILNAHIAQHVAGATQLEDGLFYKQLKAGQDMAFPADTTVYINYTGRLMNGQVFDTTVKDTAKVYDVYKSGKSYEPIAIHWGESADKITMGDSFTSVVDGFSKSLYAMHPGEKGRAWFISSLGYGSSGSSSGIIPAYATLIFDFEFVDAP
ncbi:MAG: FKBP-type peptidyl-prolyl cis-trans isomerase [Bacteroidales bacterium]|nr:FKBP-type peptidyl-prolyl cis-trans isomerase [Bacteroidales bacterium]